MEFKQKFIYLIFFSLYIFINCQEENIIKENIINLEESPNESNEEENNNIIENNKENIKQEVEDLPNEDEVNEIIENINNEDIFSIEQNNINENEINSENILIKEENEEIKVNNENIENDKLDNNSHGNENFENYNYNDKKESKFEGLKILFEKYLISFHYELLQYVPVPYDYLIMFVLGYFFMKIFAKGKNSIYVKNKRKLVDQNVAVIEKKLRDIAKIQEKLKEKNNNDERRQKPSQEINLPKELINIEKLDSIEEKLNELMKDLCERNKKDSKEKKLENNICDLQNIILKEVNKQNEEEDAEESEEEDDDEEEGEKEENEK